MTDFGTLRSLDNVADNGSYARAMIAAREARLGAAKPVRKEMPQWAALAIGVAVILPVLALIATVI